MKIKAIVFFVSILLLGLLINTNSVNAYGQYSYYMTTEDKKLFKVKESKVKSINKLLNGKLETLCFEDNQSTDKISFVCKSKWSNESGSGCGIVRNNYYEKMKNAKCVLRVRDKPEVGVQFNLKIYKFNTAPDELDISSKFFKKSIQKKELSCESSATSDILSALK